MARFIDTKDFYISRRIQPIIYKLSDLPFHIIYIYIYIYIYMCVDHYPHCYPNAISLLI